MKNAEIKIPKIVWHPERAAFQTGIDWETGKTWGRHSRLFKDVEKNLSDISKAIFRFHNLRMVGRNDYYYYFN